MKFIFFQTIIISILLATQFNAHSAEPVILKSRPVKFSGTVIKVTRTDVDKSGRNPKFIVRFTLRIESFEDTQSSFKINSTIDCTARENRIIDQIGRTLKNGDRISVGAEVIEKNPKVINALRIKLAAD